MHKAQSDWEQPAWVYHR